MTLNTKASGELLEYVGKLEEENKSLKEENQTMKDNVEFLHSCLDDRDKSIEIMKEERDFFKEQAILWRNDYKNEYEKNKKLKGEEIIKKLYTLIDNLTLIADNGIYIYSRDEIREYIEGLILGIQGKSNF